MFPHKYTFSEAIGLLRKHRHDPKLSFLYTGSELLKYGPVNLQSAHTDPFEIRVQVKYVDGEIPPHIHFDALVSILNNADRPLWEKDDPNNVVIDSML